jgi:hypothetical protein
MEKKCIIGKFPSLNAAAPPESKNGMENMFIDRVVRNCLFFSPLHRHHAAVELSLIDFHISEGLFHEILLQKFSRVTGLPADLSGLVLRE